jgi:rhodanese-related sulfurtransferase
MSHSEKFQKLADEAKAKIQEISVDQIGFEDSYPKPILVDVREDQEWEKAHVKGAIHLSRGTIEQKIEEVIPDPETPIICYCGGGNRSALVAENLQKMGYSNVQSLLGGFQAWKDANLPTENSQ